MKTLIKNANPFIMLLVPVLFAFIMGITYQAEQKIEFSSEGTTVHATSLFYKSVSVIKTVCAIAKQNVW